MAGRTTRRKFLISTQIVTPAAALASQDRGRVTGQGVRRMLVRLLNEVARETPRGGSPTSFQGSIGAWPTCVRIEPSSSKHRVDGDKAHGARR